MIFERPVLMLLVFTLLITLVVVVTVANATGQVENGECQNDDDDSLYLRDGETISYILLAVSGTLEEGFELRSNMDYKPKFGNNQHRINATFFGKALVRGYKSFLDIKNPTWREYKDTTVSDGDNNTEDSAVFKTVNPAVLPTGCDEHANRYSIYATDSRQALLALAGEPRFLSIAPDMGLTDLLVDDDLTYPDIKKLAKTYTKNSTLSRLKVGGDDIQISKIAFLTVTSTWYKSTMIPNGIIRLNEKDGGTSITDYPESTGIWSKSILNKKGSHPLYPDGCGSNPNPTRGDISGVNTSYDYMKCIDAAIRLQEAEYEYDESIGSHISSNELYREMEFCQPQDTASSSSSFGKKNCYTCQRLAQYGTDGKTIARFNQVFDACTLEEIMISAGVVNETTGKVKFPLQGCSLPPYPYNKRQTRSKRDNVEEHDDRKEEV